MCNSLTSWMEPVFWLQSFSHFYLIILFPAYQKHRCKPLFFTNVPNSPLKNVMSLFVRCSSGGPWSSETFLLMHNASQVLLSQHLLHGEILWTNGNGHYCNGLKISVLCYPLPTLPSNLSGWSWYSSHVLIVDLIAP